MVAGTYFVREHEAKLLDILTEVVEHGFGEVTIHITETKNFKTKILIVAGRSYAFFVSKDVPRLNDKDIL